MVRLVAALFLRHHRPHPLEEILKELSRLWQLRGADRHRLAAEIPLVDRLSLERFRSKPEHLAMELADGVVRNAGRRLESGRCLSERAVGVAFEEIEPK